jgi:alpha-L-rhamnosidase
MRDIFIKLSVNILWRKKAVYFFIIGITIIVYSGCSFINGKLSEAEITNLTCEFDSSPMGIETDVIRFSWMLQTVIPGQKQTAFRILVADNPETLASGKGNLWDSGKVNSDQSVLVKYKGEPFQASTRYWWKVKVWDKLGHATSWSDANWFETGLLLESDWRSAQWISMKSDNRDTTYSFRQIQTDLMEVPEFRTSYPAPLFRRDVNINKGLKSARAYVAGLGYYELTINGRKIGDHVLDPAQTNYDVYSKYVVFDISESLSIGINSLGVMLGNGFYGQTIAFPHSKLSYGKPIIKALFRFEYEDGTIDELVTDELWKTTSGPVVFDNVFAGETYDARYELPGWNMSGYDDSAWENAKAVNGPGGTISAQSLPPIRVKERLKPVRIFKSRDSWIIDFGQNISGWVRIRVNEDPGTVIRIRTAEALTRDGSAINTYSTGHFATGVEQIDMYICHGKGEEVWEPRFTYHGFQFAEISGLSGKPDADAIEAVWVYSDVDNTGYFESSDTLLNLLYEVSMNTIKGNIHGLPEDCPHREKCGWLGDAHIAAEVSIYNYDMALFFNKFILDMITGLRQTRPDKHQKSYLVPTMVAPGKRVAGTATMDWGVALIKMPWYMYVYYGDIEPFRQNYDHLKEFISYMMTYVNGEGIIENGLGDWCPPRWDRFDNPSAMLCHPYISSTAFLYRSLRIMALMAEKLDDESYAAWAGSMAETVKRAFNAKFLVAIDNTPFYWYGSQTATVLAFAYEMVPDSIFQQVAEALKYDIEVTHGGHHTCGIFGQRHIYTVLNDLGYHSLAMKILTTPDFPSQAYIVNAGLTTWPERQWEWSSGIEWDRSLNHPMQSGFAAWFHESLAGIQPSMHDPGFKRFVLKPKPVKTVEYVKVGMRSMYGTISSHYQFRDDVFLWEVSIPANSTSIVYIPNGTVTVSDLSGSYLDVMNEVTLLRSEEEYLVYHFESGTYRIEVR